MNSKKIVLIGAIVLVLLGCVLAAGCTSNNNSEQNNVPTITCDVSEYKEYHDVQIDTNYDELTDAGFVLGDSLDLHFSNGKSCLDVPYVSGYIVPRGANALVLYNGNIYLNRIDLNGLWESLELNPGDKVKITRAESQKYAAEQEANSYTISNNRSDYGSDEEFSNFRPINSGNLKKNYIYRGASPIDNSENRAPTTDSLLKKYGIKTIFTLSGTDETVRNHQNESDHNSPTFDELYANGSVIMCGISSNVFSEENMKIICNGLRDLLSHEGPYYIHCLEGKDRTGFLGVLIGALGDATEEEIAQDYLKTYENYFHITPTTNPNVYAQFKTLSLDTFLNGLTKNGTLSLKDGSIAYLKEGGMSESEISELISKITE